MKDLPILMSGPMARAILREIEAPGTGKTQTRRVLTPYCDEAPAFVDQGVITALDERERPYRWPRTKAVGDRLYVRESWRVSCLFDKRPPRDLSANTFVGFEASGGPKMGGKLRPGIHMPRWASRLTLYVTEVRVERLSCISEEDARAEGADPVMVPPDGGSVPYIEGYRALWDSINGPGSWARNDWVAAYTFTPRLGNIDSLPATLMEDA